MMQIQAEAFWAHDHQSAAAAQYSVLPRQASPAIISKVPLPTGRVYVAIHFPTGQARTIV
eukprot:385279-Amphidinium_carterae.2